MPDVRLPDAVADVIRSVVPSIVDQVRKHLNDLSLHPRWGTLQRDGEYEGLWAWRMPIRRPPLSAWFVVLYDNCARDGYIEIIDFGIWDDGSKRLQPPKFR